MKRVVQPLPVERRGSPVAEDVPIFASRHRFPSAQKAIIYKMHYALELGLVLRGRVVWRNRQQEEKLKPGQIWLGGIWETHAYDIVAAPCEVVVFAIWPAALAAMTCPEAPCFNWMAPFIAGFKNRPRIPDSLRPFAINLGKRMAALRITMETAKNNERIRLKLRLCLMEALLALTEQWTPPANRKPRPISVYSRLNYAVELVFHQHRFVSAHEAARICEISRDAFCATFRDLMGLPFADFALRYRLDGARHQLLTTPDPIKKIAREWGFIDHSHFHHAFIRHYGCKPSAYRKSICPFVG